MMAPCPAALGRLRRTTRRHILFLIVHHPMRILGIDPGLQTTGFGVIEVEGHALHYIASGTIKTTHLPRGDLPARLKVLFEGVAEVRERYQPDASVVEIVFVNVNPQSTLLLGQARGACVTALVTTGLPVAEYTALQMKQAVAGSGRAAKAQVQEMVRRLLQLPGLPGTDAADALGLAITHAHAGQSLARLAQAAQASRRNTGAYKAGRVF
jgi:crossover junction endodeoxyribonuclease RuvC